MLSLFLYSSLCDEAQSVSATCKIINGKPVITEGLDDKDSATAYATFNNSIHQVGWFQFHVASNPGYDSKDIMLCAGALEGYLSHDNIYDHFQSIKEMNEWGDRVPQNVYDFAAANLQYVRESVEAYSDIQYWRQVGLIETQFEGIIQGFQMSKNTSVSMDEVELYIIQSEGDINDVAEILPQPGLTREQRRRRSNVQGGSHCSGLIKILKNYSDIFFSHAAWSDYRDLYGELKEYDLHIPEFAANRLIISTRIGMMSSYDDFYMNDHNLFVLETTMNNFNEDLESTIVPNVLFTWIRALTATWTASDGKDWTERFSKQNSGTYNNEYLVLDGNKFTPNQKPTTDLLWIIEQFPGIFRSQDITDQLVNDTYFPSFNTPFFEELYVYAHYPEHVASWGDTGNYWTYNTSARYYIFKRDAPRVNSFEDFQALMTYNDWKNDLYSNGDAGQQILSRYDQRPANLNPLLKKRAFGGLDAKCLRLTEAMTKMRMHARASPAYENNPVWKFGEPPFENEHWPGLPTEWHFNWTTFDSDANDTCIGAQTKKDCFKIANCGWCEDSQACYPGEKNYPWMGQTCEAGWQIKTELQSWAVPVIASVSVVILLFCGTIYVVFFINKRKEKLA